jgi:hypothetical protein
MRDYNALLTEQANQAVRNNITKKFIVTYDIAGVHWVTIRTRRGGVIGRSPNPVTAHIRAWKLWLSELPHAFSY